MFVLTRGPWTEFFLPFHYTLHTNSGKKEIWNLETV